MNISNNDIQNVREIIIVSKKQKVPTTVSVTSLVRAAEPITTNVIVKKPRLCEISVEDNGRTPAPLAVARRNARERNRVRQVNEAFAALRCHIPEEVAAAFENVNSNRCTNKKLSKVETLRMAVEYIRNLESLLNIGHADKENNTSRQSMESFPSPASSSPRENSQERSYYSIHSPALDDEDIEEDDVDSSVHQLPPQQYVDLTLADTFQLVSTPHLYEEEEGTQPLTPSSDLIGHEEVNAHILDGHFPFPNSAEQFTVIPENYCNGAEINDNDFEMKYPGSIDQQIQNYGETVPLEAINADLILNGEYKFKEEVAFRENQYNDIDLKKELPDIHVTPEDREQFEETLKWWQEKTRQNHFILGRKKN